MCLKFNNYFALKRTMQHSLKLGVINTSANTRCSLDVHEEDRILCRTRAESFAQRECDVITACPIAQKTLRAFANIHRRPTKLGSVLLRRTQ